MTDFFRFPTTPHLAWLRLTCRAATSCLPTPKSSFTGRRSGHRGDHGANLGISIGPDGAVPSRGQYLLSRIADNSRVCPIGSISTAPTCSTPEPGLILFENGAPPGIRCIIQACPTGIWCSTCTRRTRLSEYRDAMCSRSIGLNGAVPAARHHALPELKHMVMNTPSRFRGGEPLKAWWYVESRRCGARRGLRCAPTSRGEEHWRRRAIEWNRID